MEQQSQTQRLASEAEKTGLKALVQRPDTNRCRRIIQPLVHVVHEGIQASDKSQPKQNKKECKID